MKTRESIKADHKEFIDNKGDIEGDVEITDNNYNQKSYEQAYDDAVKEPNVENICRYSTQMMKAIESDLGSELSPGDIRSLILLRESMDGYVNDFDGWGESSNPKGEAAMYRLFGAAPLALKAQETIALDKSLIERPNERMQYRFETADFGSRLHDVLETNPNIKISELSEALTAVVNEFAPIDNNMLDTYIKDKIRGTRSEYIFKKAFNNVPGARLINPSAWQDLKGVDYILEANNQSYNIDVKSSLDQIHAISKDANSPDMYAIKQGLKNKSRDGQRIVIWPGAIDRMFNYDSFELKDEYQKIVNDKILLSIHMATLEYNNR